MRASHPTRADSSISASRATKSSRSRPLSPRRLRRSTSAVALVSPGFVETHLHLDKACILDRCRAEGDLGAAIREVTRLKSAFTAEDVYDRAKHTLERCILNGTTHVRAHLEVDPVIGLRGLEGVLPLVREYAWAVDLELCIFPQDGMLNNQGTEELMVAALRRGGHLIGACPYTDTDPHGQIDRVFAI